MRDRVDPTGTLHLVRAALRRDRLRIAVWTLAIPVMVVVSAESVRGVFPTQADLDAAAESSDNPAILAFQGPAQALDTLGGQVAFQIGAPGLVIVALMALLMTNRLTRSEEESGRLELVRSFPVGRDAPTIAAALVVGAMSVVVGSLIVVGLALLDLPMVGSISFALGYTTVGLVFVAVTLVTAQVTDNSRLAGGSAGVVLGAAFVLRAIGDTGPDAVAWLSPLGWVQHARPYAGERWWPFAVAGLAVVGLARGAAALQARRDLGGGLLAPRAGPAAGTRRLGTPLGLAARLQRGSVMGWTAGTALLALVYGSITSAIESFVEDNPQLADFLLQTGGNLTDAYLATAGRTLALIGAGYAVQSMLRLRAEEAADRAESILATGVSRLSYWRAHVVVASVGSLVVLTVAGLVLGVSAALAVGDGSLVLRGTGALVAYLPAVLVMVGSTALLVCALPNRAALAWVALSVALVITMFGPILDLPSWAIRISPFENLAFVPAESITVSSVTALLVITAMALAMSMVWYQRRDIAA